MARVTVEDCLKHVKNRFELVIIATKRARELMITGKEPFVEWERDKATVVALREIAAGYINAYILDQADPSFQIKPKTTIYSEEEAMEDMSSLDENVAVVANEEDLEALGNDSGAFEEEKI